MLMFLDHTLKLLQSAVNVAGVKIIDSESGLGVFHFPSRLDTGMHSFAMYLFPLFRSRPNRSERLFGADAVAMWLARSLHGACNAIQCRIRDTQAQQELL